MTVTATITNVRAGLRARLATVPGLRVYGSVQSGIVVPAAVVAPAPGRFLVYDTSMARGSDDYLFAVLLLASQASDTAGEALLDSYLAGSGSSSVKAAIEADPTLGGVAQFVAVQDARNYRATPYDGVSYYSAELFVAVGV